MERQIYLIIATVALAVDLIVAFRAVRRGQRAARHLGITLFLAAIVDASYTSSIMVQNYVLMKCLLALYFSCISIMLLCLLVHIMVYTGVQMSAEHLWWIRVAGVFVALDVVVQWINPFREIVMQFRYHPEHTIVWGFRPMLPYQLHLTLCYVLVGASVLHLLIKTIKTPYVYRGKYYTTIAGLFLSVAMNAVCLLLQNEGMPDYSQMAYCVMGVILYLDMFHSSQQGMLNSIRHVVLDELGHPVILFGENNQVAECNQPASFLLPDWKPGCQRGMEEFLEKWGFDEKYLTASDNSSFLWTYEKGKQHNNYRVDYRVIKDRKDRVIGRMLIFTDTTLKTDLLTGFLAMHTFERLCAGTDIDEVYPVPVAVFDINRLSEINQTYGEHVGDLCIQKLALSIRKYCPDWAWFARINDANLLVAAPHTTYEDMRECVEQVTADCLANGPKGIRLGVQFAISVSDQNQRSIQQAAQIALSSMRARKLMDQGSAHSSLLDSLAQTLMEADGTTEAHVERTKTMGELLGKRLQFTDSQMSDLSLLCLLHDIGKLGIPTEILNKPEKLNGWEWEVMKSHVEKGYRIAKASAELSDIAEYIRYHHERWDGKGYPDGLKQEQTPLLSRVIAIVDAYDAMTNDRPYHKAISEEAARAEIARCAGTQFDPYLASEFLQMLDELMPLAS